MKAYYDHGGITIYHADWREVIPSLKWSGVVVTDPPYGTGGWRRTTSGMGSDPRGSLVREEWDDGATDWVPAFAPSATAIVSFWPSAHAVDFLLRARESGLCKHRTLYMRKADPKPMSANRTKWSVEPIWVLSRDGFALTGGSDVVDVSTPRFGRDSEAVGHPYQKPLKAMTWILSKLGPELIVDPFMGSGTTLRAAKDDGRKAIGIEINELYCEVAAKRLAQEVLFS